MSRVNSYQFINKQEIKQIKFYRLLKQLLINLTKIYANRRFHLGYQHMPRTFLDAYTQLIVLKGTFKTLFKTQTESTKYRYAIR